MTDERSSRGGAALFAAVVLASGCYFAFSDHGLAHEPAFADEGAVLAQSRYYRLVLERRFADPDWIDHAAYDHQPLYKYLVGFALHVSGQYDRIPTDLGEFKRWMNGGVRAPDVDCRLLTARWAMLALSSLGVGLMFLFVRRLRGTFTALVATAVLVSSPLVYTHSRRAMIDLPAIGLCAGVLWAAARLAIHAGRSRLASYGLFVVLGALAPLAKWNAAVGCVAAAVVGLLVLLTGPAGQRMIGGVLVLGAVAAAALFVALDPYYWSKPDLGDLAARLGSVDQYSGQEYKRLANASPWERGRHALDYRRQSMATAKTLFPNDYLAPAERPAAIILEGMGRWTLGNRLYSVPEAERPRSERRQPRDLINALIVAPFALIGFVSAFRAGWAERNARRFPVHWFLVAWVVLDLATLLANLTVDWDRYYLSVVAWSSVAFAVGLNAVWRSVVAQLRLKPKELTPL